MSTSVRKGLGLWMLTALVAGNMIGSGVFLLPASLAQYGSISILGWTITALGALCLALVFSKLSTWIPKTGGPYAYCREGFGDYIGFTVAYNYWIALWVGNAGIAVAFASYLSVFFPWITASAFNTCITSIVTVWILTLINVSGVRQAGMVQLITTILKLLPLLLIGTVGLLCIKPEYLAQFNVSQHSNFAAITGTASLTLWAFIGLESATVPADDVENPSKNIPRATILGTVLAAIVYILSTTAIMGLVPNAQLVQSTSPYADAAKAIFGNWGEWLVAIGAVVSCFGALNGWTLLQGQVPMAAARDSLFPKAFARVSRKGTPAFGLIISSLLITGLLLLTINESLVKQFTFIILLATLSTLIPYLFTSMAQILIYLKRPEERVRSAMPVVISIIAMAYVFWAISGAGMHVVYYGSLLLFSSIPVYVWMQWCASRDK